VSRNRGLIIFEAEILFFGGLKCHKGFAAYQRELKLVHEIFTI
jgi:hypothetical protein